MPEVNVNVELKDGELQPLLQAAVLNAIGDQGRELIIKQAIDYLTTKGTRYPNEKTTPLEDHLYRVAENIAKTILSDKIENDPEFREKIEEVYKEAIKRAFDEEQREKLVAKLSSAFYQVLSGESNRY